ncbi:MAG TPA: LysR family transcriptional regulator [Steroidobacteraceae bacterium]|nr:LysR family transcriptional regulator [Steroidobacteraceae bacterium]
MTSSPLDLNLLLVLNTVLTEGSVAKAAGRLHVTPSAVSNALARLRLLLGDPLVTRKGRGIVPTPRALELAPILAKGLQDLNDAVRASGFTPATTTRRFTLALSDAGQVALLPRIVSLFTREMPQARLRVVGIDSLVLLGGLAGPEIDAVIGPATVGADTHVERLFEHNAVLICREGHPALAKAADARILGTLRHIAIDMVPGQALRDLAGTAYAKARITRDVAMTVPTFFAAAAVVAATDLVATVPASLLDAVGHLLRLRALPSAVTPLPITTNLCWHERTHADSAAAAFRDVVRRAATAGLSAVRAAGAPERAGKARSKHSMRLPGQ